MDIRELFAEAYLEERPDMTREEFDLLYSVDWHRDDFTSVAYFSFPVGGDTEICGVGIARAYDPVTSAQVGWLALEDPGDFPGEYRISLHPTAQEAFTAARAYAEQNQGARR